MLKRVFGVRRRDGVPHDELVEAWRDEHIPNVVRDLAPDRYAVTFFRQREGTPFDGMAVLGFDDAERGRAVFTRSDPPKACFGDALTQRAVPRAFVFDATERVQVDGPRGPFKSVALVTKRPGTPMADFVRHWLDVHAPNVAGAMSGHDDEFRYVISIGESLAEDAPYHGIAEVYYASADAWKAHGKALRPDGFDAVAQARPEAFLVGQEVLVR
ncbi:MAG: hypothetical protein GEV08_24280 [Acidimicrobiia bacterium]|nr:hypothetical protein [Acidimicrobiia bacterium]